VRLLRLKLDQFRSHEALDIELAGVTCAAIVGRNGAGKSSIFKAIDYALYGGGGASADDLLRHQAKQGGVTLEVDVDGRLWRISRGRERSRKSWLVVEQGTMPGPAWAPVPQNTIDDAQRFLDANVLAMDRDAFLASVYAPQGEAGLLAAMKPGERKALLGGLLGLDRYEAWREVAAQDARAAAERAHGLRLQVEGERARQGQLAAVAGGVSELETQERGFVDVIEQIDVDLAAAIAREQAAADVRRRADLVAQMRALRAAAGEAKNRNDRRSALRETIASLRPARDAWPGWQQLLVDHQELVARARAERDGLQQSIHHAELRVAELEGRAAATRRRLQEAERRESAADVAVSRATAARAALADESTPSESCPVCGQEVHGDAHDRVVADLELRRGAADEQVRSMAESLEQASAAVAGTREEVAQADRAEATSREELGAERARMSKAPAAAVPAFRQDEYNDAQQRVMGLVTAEGGLQSLGPLDEDLAALRGEWGRLKAEAEQLPESVPDGPSPADVRARRAQQETSLTQVRGALERARAAAAEVERIDAAVTTVEREAGEFDTLKRARDVVAAACSRNGIPAMILDGAVEGIEGAANDALERLGSSMRIRLATQVAKKSGGSKETLEIMVDDGAFERPLASFSGGERYRVHVALRLGLAAVLEASSGRPCDLLLVDEVTDLDEEGVRLFAELLARVDRQVLLVTHAAELTVAMPQRIVVNRPSDAAPSEVMIT
jgi:exonuclease SbcC